MGELFVPAAIVSAPEITLESFVPLVVLYVTLTAVEVVLATKLIGPV